MGGFFYAFPDQYRSRIMDSPAAGLAVADNGGIDAGGQQGGQTGFRVFRRDGPQKAARGFRGKQQCAKPLQGLFGRVIREFHFIQKGFPISGGTAWDSFSLHALPGARDEWYRFRVDRKIHSAFSRHFQSMTEERKTGHIRRRPACPARNARRASRLSAFIDLIAAPIQEGSTSWLLRLW
jgi:hypothetical protein